MFEPGVKYKGRWSGYLRVQSDDPSLTTFRSGQEFTLPITGNELWLDALTAQTTATVFFSLSLPSQRCCCLFSGILTQKAKPQSLLLGSRWKRLQPTSVYNLRLPWRMDLRSEKEKMLASELYNANDPELRQLRNRARRLQRQYNQTTEEEKEAREAILKEWFGFKGEEVFIEPPFTCDYGGNLYVGDGTYLNFDCVVLDTCRVDIGSHVKFGPKVQIYTATHPLDATQRTTPPYLEGGLPIKVGNNVWLGGGCIICPGVTIGDNSTIGAGAVVTKNVPANVVAAGNPARVIKELAPPPH